MKSAKASEEEKKEAFEALAKYDQLTEDDQRKRFTHEHISVKEVVCICMHIHVCTYIYIYAHYLLHLLHDMAAPVIIQ